MENKNNSGNNWGFFIFLFVFIYIFLLMFSKNPQNKEDLKTYIKWWG